MIKCTSIDASGYIAWTIFVFNMLVELYLLATVQSRIDINNYCIF
jgi:hypothetical protein